MKKLPEITESWESLYDIVSAPVKTRIFSFALKHKLFDHLNTPVYALPVAKELNFHPRNTELVLNVLAGMGILHKKQGEFFNTSKTREFLHSQSEKYIGDFLTHVQSWQDSIESIVENNVVNGPPSQKPDFSNPDIWAESAELSASYQKAGGAQEAAKVISKLPEFPDMKKMLDLGGGAGFYCMGIVDAHPSMKGFIFEQPAVAEVAQKFIEKQNASDRISVLKGNYMRDTIGGGYDLIFASATLNFVKNRIDEVLKKIYYALAPGGVFVSHADGLFNERTHPVNYIAEFLSAELMGNDFGFPKGFIAEKMKEAGFINIESTQTRTGSGVMDVDIGRKRS